MTNNFLYHSKDNLVWLWESIVRGRRALLKDGNKHTQLRVRACIRQTRVHRHTHTHTHVLFLSNSLPQHERCGIKNKRKTLAKIFQQYC